MAASRCTLCGGSAGRLNRNGEHELCRAFSVRGMPTPSLGDMCAVCGGAGTTGKGGAMLFFSLGPAAIRKSIDAQFPPCPCCGGSGVEPGTSEAGDA
jgi:hypothetical protein